MQHETTEGIPRQLRYTHDTHEHTHEHPPEHPHEHARDHAVGHPHEFARDDVPRAGAAARSRWRFSSAVEAARHLGNPR